VLQRRIVKSRKTTDNARKVRLLPVTNETPEPGDFPLGSLQSRAAARALAQYCKPKPKVRIFENGVLKKEYEYDGEEDFIIGIEQIGEQQ
jgi:hypothetical protein